MKQILLYTGLNFLEIFTAFFIIGLIAARRFPYAEFSGEVQDEWRKCYWQGVLVSTLGVLLVFEEAFAELIGYRSLKIRSIDVIGANMVVLISFIGVLLILWGYFLMPPKDPEDGDDDFWKTGPEEPPPLANVKPNEKSDRAQEIKRLAQKLNRDTAGGIDALESAIANHELATRMQLAISQQEQQDMAAKLERDKAKAQHNIYNAIRRKDLKAIEAMIAKGADVDCPNEEGKTPRAYAEELGDEKVLGVLG